MSSLFRPLSPTLPDNILNLQYKLPLLELILHIMRPHIHPSNNRQIPHITLLRQIARTAMTAKPTDLVRPAVHLLRVLPVTVHVHTIG